METVLQWGLYCITMILIPFIYWCIDEKKCLCVGIPILFSVWVGLINILAGLLVGGIILCSYFFVIRRGLLRRPLEALRAAYSPRAGMLASAVLAFIMILYRPSPELLLPGGMILGLGTGYILCKRHVGFSAAVNREGAAKYALLLARFVLGMAGLAALFIVTGKITDLFIDSGNYDLIVFMRFVLLAFWISAIAPWLFCKIKLASNER
ncbi:MAG: hypothetical protein FWD36_09215 [Treponema sp.]|nr:hypothetical protein [Treponema sp.]